jgi:hypothetical protein
MKFEEGTTTPENDPVESRLPEKLVEVLKGVPLK